MADGSEDTGEETGQQSADCSFGQQISGGGTAAGFTTLDISIGSDQYKVQTNPWGGATQTITAGGGKVFSIDSITHPPGGNDWDVHTFPSVYKGTAYGGEPTTGSGLPIAVSDISSVCTGMRTNAIGNSYSGNATYDVYFTHDQNYAGGPPDTYLMVWYVAKSLNPINSPGEGWDCAANPPTFIGACSGAGDVMINGQRFYRFRGPNGNAEVISYVPDSAMHEWEFDLNDFIQDAISVGAVTPGMYLQSIQGGLEVADGGNGLMIEDFYANVE
ncbi:MAG: hypothetical protein AAF799_08210 [Myxococcota bacterium]